MNTKNLRATPAVARRSLVFAACLRRLQAPFRCGRQERDLPFSDSEPIRNPIERNPMFAHNKRLQYTVRVNECNPGLANLMLEQFGGPQGELAAACRYFTQYLAEDDPGRRDMLIDIATEELSHLEVIGTIVAMLNKGAKGKLAEGVDGEAELYRNISGSGNDSHVTQ